MTTISPDFAPFALRMEAEQLPPLFIRSFAHYYRQLAAGENGLIPEASIEPVRQLPDAERFAGSYAAAGRAALPRTVIIKLNGGLGTGMGLTLAKSLLVVKNDLTFLDIIARQATQAGTPLLLMNSFATEEDSLEVLRRYPALSDHGIPLSFQQHKQLKVNADDLSPAVWPADPELAWCPPGHGDLYIALLTSGMLPLLMERGIEYAFVSNADNLGATLDLDILGYLASQQAPFLMEVADRTAIDRKGGHLAIDARGRLLLRELAQCPEEDQGAFQDISRHRYFNTNNLWIHLPTLWRLLEERDSFLGLPMIRNMKTVDPRNKQSPAVYQLETAMGSAISVFDGAQAVRVPRERFAPVKRTDDLLAVRSDAYELTPDFRVRLVAARRGIPPTIELDRQHYEFINLLDERFPAGAPSLVHCRSLRVNGDVRFGRGVVVRGDACFVNEGEQQLSVPDGLELENRTWPD